MFINQIFKGSGIKATMLDFLIPGLGEDLNYLKKGMAMLFKLSWRNRSPKYKSLKNHHSLSIYNKNEKVSIIINCYNGEKYLKRH